MKDAFQPWIWTFPSATKAVETKEQQHPSAERFRAHYCLDSQILAVRCPARQLQADYTQTSTVSPETYSEVRQLIKAKQRANTEQEVGWLGRALGVHQEPLIALSSKNTPCPVSRGVSRD